MQVRYDGSHDAVVVRDLAEAVTGAQLVVFGEAVEVPIRGGDIAERDERARRLLEQPDNWQPADAEAEWLAGVMAEEAAAALAERSRPIELTTWPEKAPARGRRSTQTNEQTDRGPGASGTGG